jgi:hypothetical protein
LIVGFYEKDEDKDIAVVAPERVNRAVPIRLAVVSSYLFIFIG